MTAFFGFGATPPRHHVSLFARARSPLVPLCVAPCVCAIAPGGRPFRCPGDVGPEGRLPFVARVFRACMQTGTGPVLRHSRHVPQHTMPGSGRAPGPPAGPGWIFSHRSSVFPSFGDSFGAPHPGISSTAFRQSTHHHGLIGYTLTGYIMTGYIPLPDFKSGLKKIKNGRTEDAAGACLALVFTLLSA